ncbi:MAG: extracellular solute-binding protein, partial [Alphaproteobacteria bacterium]
MTFALPRLALVLAALLLAPVFAVPVVAETGPAPRHGIAMHGQPKYGPDFRHFDYVNPTAPKGGDVRFGVQGTFDSFNAFIVKGNPAAGMGGIYETLMASSADEPFSKYGLIAESIETPDDRSWAIFTLRREARWHDGAPITPEDVIWTLETLKTKGHPAYRFFYREVVGAEKIGPRRIKFTFAGGNNRELPLIVADMQILPKHYWEGRDFTRTTLKPPPGSGPYRIVAFEPGRFIRYERVVDYWAADLPVNKGRYNFDTEIFEYYRDATVIREAVKSGDLDRRSENQAKAWALAYDVPAVRDGWLKLEAF